MDIIRNRAFARAGLVGNPSDGYNGKTISVIVRNFHALVVLYPWEEIEILGSSSDVCQFSSVADVAADVRKHGYYGGIPLVKSTIKRFVEYCQHREISLHKRNFSIRYESTIPRQVGLAGSSAIVVATLRCLMDFYDVRIPEVIQPSIALAVEADLGITAGLQDRVIQVYEGMVYMDFAKARMQQLHGYDYGVYERLSLDLLPKLYLAYSDADDSDCVQPTGAVHLPIRVRFLQRDPKVLQAMDTFAGLAAQARTAIGARDRDGLDKLINENFETRLAIYENMLPGQIRMVRTAQKEGASAQFAGSGGAIIGVYRDEAMFERLQGALRAIGCRVIKPVVEPEGNAAGGKA